MPTTSHYKKKHYCKTQRYCKHCKHCTLNILENKHVAMIPQVGDMCRMNNDVTMELKGTPVFFTNGNVKI